MAKIIVIIGILIPDGPLMVSWGWQGFARGSGGKTMIYQCMLISPCEQIESIPSASCRNPHANEAPRPLGVLLIRRTIVGHNMIVDPELIARFKFKPSRQPG